MIADLVLERFPPKDFSVPHYHQPAPTGCYPGTKLLTTPYLDRLCWVYVGRTYAGAFLISQEGDPINPEIISVT